MWQSQTTLYVEDSEDPAVKTVQPTIKTGRKWKVAEDEDDANALSLRKQLGKLKLTAKGWDHLQQSGGQSRREREKRHGNQ